jgi:creatinine amidohydrolase
MLTPATSVEEAARGAGVAVLPVGSFEQHGGHLPLITDTVVACLIASRIAQDYDLFLLPPLTIGCSHEHAAFAGTVSISATTLHLLVTEIAADLNRQGVRQLVIVNGHGGNYVLSNVVQEANTTERRMLLYPGRADWEHARRAAGCVTDIHDDMHGGELETSLLQFAYPQLVRDTWTTADSQASDRPDFLLLGTAGYTPNGIIGTPSAATPHKGRALLDDLSASFARPLKMLTAVAQEASKSEH